MNIPDAIKSIEKLSREMTVASENAQVAATRYEAHLSLYNAAVSMGDNKEAEDQRLRVHAQIDALLDAGYELHSRRRKIMEIGITPE